jgi:HAD superfamily hydrolase (TIGR01509 family)
MAAIHTSERTLDSAATPVVVDLSTAKAVIWDMDETLAGTASQWMAAEVQTLALVGRVWDADLSRKYKGMNAGDVATVMHREIKPANVTLEQMRRTMRDGLIAAFHATPPAPMRGAVQMVRALHGQRPQALASGSPLEVIEFTLNQLGVRDAFDIILSSESVTRGKPHPDVFLATAELLKLSPADCYVIEDSLIGTQAAQAAGMRCLTIPSLLAATPAIAQIATVVAPSLEQVRFTF